MSKENTFDKRRNFIEEKREQLGREYTEYFE